MSHFSRLMCRCQPDDSQGLASMTFTANGDTKTLPGCVVYIPTNDESLKNVLHLKDGGSSATCYYVIGPWFEDDKVDLKASCTKVDIVVYRFTKDKDKTFLIDKNDFSNIVCKKNVIVIPLTSDKRSRFMKKWSSQIVICTTGKDICDMYRDFVLFVFKKETVYPPKQKPQAQRSSSPKTSNELLKFKYYGFQIKQNEQHTICHLGEMRHMETLMNAGMILKQAKSDHHYELLGYYKKHQNVINIYSFCSESPFSLHVNGGNNEPVYEESTGIPRTNSEPCSLVTPHLQGNSPQENGATHGDSANGDNEPGNSSPGIHNNSEHGEAANSDQQRNNTPGLHNNLEHGVATNGSQPGNNSPGLHNNSEYRVAVNSDQQGNNSAGQTNSSIHQQLNVDSGQVERTSRQCGSLRTFPTNLGLPESNSLSQTVVTGQPGSSRPRQTAPKTSQELFMTLAIKMNTDWRRIGVSLGIEEYQLKNTDANFNRIEDKTYDMLNKWKQSLGKDATPQKLEAVLRRADITDLAEIVQDFITHQPPQHT